MSQGKRYKFQDSVLSISTGFAAVKTITAITKANPAVASIAAHGLVLGDVGKITGVAGMTQLNEALYVVDNPLTGSIQLAGVDSTDYPAFVGNSPNLARFAPAVMSPFCELTGANQQDGTAGEIEVSTICSTAKEFEVGLGDSGSLQLDFNWAGNQAVQASQRASKKSGDQIAVKVKFPKDGGTVIMLGYVQQTSFAGQVNGVWTASATMKLTGEIFVLPAVA